MLHDIEWGRIIFDEAHHLRNAKNSAHLGALKLRSTIRWLVTGTPIQNSKKDFHSLCSQLGLPSSYYKDRKNLVELVRMFIIKRTKKETGIVLPELNVQTEMVDWETEEEMNFAKNLHALLNFSKIEKKYVDAYISQLNLSKLTLLIRARQSCVYPALMCGPAGEYMDKGILLDEPGTRVGLLGKSKMNHVLGKIIARKDNGFSKIVFCHFRGEIDYLQTSLVSEGMTVSVFDGRVTPSQREEILKRPCDVLLLQIQTGCEGLNLQHFNEVYFVSPHWNPAMEDQAIARCHRIGQKNKVYVFRFVMKGFDKDDNTMTLDTYATAIQETKRDMMENIYEEDSEVVDE